jgi:hypothetical protein
MDLLFKKGFKKQAAAISLKMPSFGKSLRGSAFAMPSKSVKVDLPKFGITKGNAKSGYNSGSTKGIETTAY